MPSRTMARPALAAALLSAALLGGCTEPPEPDGGRYVRRGPEGRIVSTDCLGPGQPDARGSWPGDDPVRFRFMPPGCATANAIAQMVVDPDDLLHGQPLAPGAALPVARAIERYYARGDDVGTPAPAPANAPGPAQATAQPPSPAPAPAAPGDAAAGLLQGPLTQASGAQAPAP